MFKQKAFNTQSGNAVIIVLAVLVVVAVGALAYLSGKMSSEGKGNAPEAQQTAAAGQQLEIEPGNPVVAKVSGEEISRNEVLAFIQNNIPPNARQMPLEQLYSIALEQVINSRIIADKTKDIRLDNDPAVKQQLEQAKKNIVRSVYIQKQVDKRMTDERLMQVYEQYKAGFPKVQEVKAAHILVKDEKLAKDLLKQIKEGADFAELAKANSVDATAQNGGQLDYFVKDQVVPEFGEAAFSSDAGSVVPKVVKSEFGYHIIRVDDKRMRQPPAFEDVKPVLQAQLRGVVLDEVVQEWKESTNVERFDINGKPAKSEVSENAG